MGKSCLFAYFVVVACVATYLTTTLWMATPKDNPPVSAGGALDCTDNLGDHPKIVRLDPDAVAIGENYVNVAIYGCNLKVDPKVTFNGLDRQSSPAGDNELIVPLQASDFAAPGNIPISVETQVSSDKGNANKRLLSNILNLRIKSASDLSAVWVVWGRKKEISLELRLILLVMFTGVLSASVSGLKSFVDYAGNKTFDSSWYWFYYAEPFVGSGLAFIFYLVIRAGFLAGTSADIKAVNPFGFVAVAALVGMFSDAAFRKLNEIFDTLFKVEAKDTRSGKLSDLSINSTSPLPTGTHGVAYTFVFEASGGKPDYTWTAVTNPPGGLTLSQQGLLTGTPPAAVAEMTFTVRVTDSAGTAATEEFKVTIN
jgi:putative Ig domain-containing protein